MQYNECQACMISIMEIFLFHILYNYLYTHNITEYYIFHIREAENNLK